MVLIVSIETHEEKKYRWDTKTWMGHCGLFDNLSNNDGGWALVTQYNTPT